MAKQRQKWKEEKKTTPYNLHREEKVQFLLPTMKNVYIFIVGVIFLGIRSPYTFLFCQSVYLNLYSLLTLSSFSVTFMAMIVIGLGLLFGPNVWTTWIHRFTKRFTYFWFHESHNQRRRWAKSVNENYGENLRFRVIKMFGLTPSTTKQIGHLNLCKMYKSMHRRTGAVSFEVG